MPHAQPPILGTGEHGPHVTVVDEVPARCGGQDSGDVLVARAVEQHRAAGIDLRMGTRVTAVDLDARTVTAHGPAGVEELGYDDLVIATGAAPVVPEWARAEGGAPLPGTGPVSTLDDGREWLDRMATEGDVIVAGGGYRRGRDLTGGGRHPHGDRSR